MEEVFIRDLTDQFVKHLKELEIEMRSYKDENRIWITDAGISNSAGNLCIHLIGNLNHFIGHVYGGSNYKRNRSAEFTTRNLPLTELISRIHETQIIIKESLIKFDVARLKDKAPVQSFDYTNRQFLFHLLYHLGYHIGQINYHRRILDN